MTAGKSAEIDSSVASRNSVDSLSSASTTSLVFERIQERLSVPKMPQVRRQGRAPSLPRSNATPYVDDVDQDHLHLSDLEDDDPLKEEADGTDDLETGPFLAAPAAKANEKMDRGLRRMIIIAAALVTLAWVIGLFAYIGTKAYKPASHKEVDLQTDRKGSGKKITMDQIRSYYWHPRSHDIRWIASPDGEDGLLLEIGGSSQGHVVVEDVRSMNSDAAALADVKLTQQRTLMKSNIFSYNGSNHVPTSYKPSKDLKKILLATEVQRNWRHSTTGIYWFLDVATQVTEPLIPDEPTARIQLAQWSPTGDSIVFTRSNNMFLRKVGSKEVIQITKDGGADIFYGVPDWVYEEEVFGSDTATWWSEDGKFVAFLRTNESGVPDYPVQYFVSRPSGDKPEPGMESYPEVRQIKYPKAGAHNPVVDLQFYDVAKGDVFSVEISGGFKDDNRLITTVVWTGDKVLVKETNRISDVMRVVLVDVAARSGKTVRTIDVDKLDGGWFEISQQTQFIPADPANGRKADGYIDTVIHDNGDHLAYFTPLDNPEPIMLTSGNWEVVDSPLAVDLKNNLVYLTATKDGNTQRHIYTVKLDGTDLKAWTDTSQEGYYGATFSAGAGFALLSYRGPKVPWQKVSSTPSNPAPYEHVIEKNDVLDERARTHELPVLKYGTLEVDGVALNYVERRPPHFNEKKTYPVLFQQYSGPGSQSVAKTFSVDFQSYVAAALGYVVVTVDGRGTGFMGRKNRVLVRGQLGTHEAADQIAAARHWAGLKYVDAKRLAIWGWSYGGYQTLKTLEQDAGRTFSYGMAVAPVIDWRFYDSIYTERYMRTPQANAAGYDASAVKNVTALSQNVRFLLMHGVADDNVHFQNSLTLLDQLDLAGVENYDVHVFPDSDHGIYFHNANSIVYDKLENWLINAFNGVWLKTAHPKPVDSKMEKEKEKRSA